MCGSCGKGKEDAVKRFSGASGRFKKGKGIKPKTFEELQEEIKKRAEKK